ncbi:MAG: cupin domain-containing protein [Terracidiphilus sp.]|jgi:quercetin dioxygenase-like cupin family protein
MINRRDVVAGLIGMPCAMNALAASAPEGETGGQIMGSTVFAWEDMNPVKTATGEARSLCKAPTATLDELEMHVTTLNPGQTSHPPHRHVNEELIILREGQCETLSNGVWVKVGPGSVVFNASNGLHGFRNVGTAPATYHVINWSSKKPATC